MMKMDGSSPMCGLSVPPAMLKPRPELPWAEGGEEGQLPSLPTFGKANGEENGLGSCDQSRKGQAYKTGHLENMGTERSTDREQGGLRWRSLLTLSKVISSYSISPSVPFTCNSSTDQKHRNSETDIPTRDAAPPLLLEPRLSLSPSFLLQWPQNLNNSHILELLGCLC